MKILFLTTHNLATNPRLHKEIKLAISEGHEVDVVCFEFENWSYDFNQDLKKELSEADLLIIPAGRKPFISWISSLFYEKSLRVVDKIFSLSGSLLSHAVARRSILLTRKVRSLSKAYDLVIGHHPAAIYPVVLAGRKFKCRTGFDIEDYHPGEGTNSVEQGLIKRLIKQYLPRMHYVSFASALIEQQTYEDLGCRGENWFVMLNHFQSADFVPPVKQINHPLRLVWFSQNISYNRGLEQIIPVLTRYRACLELTLIGNLKQEFYKEFLEQSPFIKIVPPQSQVKLHQLLSTFDIGLAIEPGKDQNNMLALGNKLLAYFQSGLYILASDTPAHRDFFAQFPQHGTLTPLTADTVSDALDKLLDQKNEIYNAKEERYEQGKMLCWETASLKLISAWTKHD